MKNLTDEQFGAATVLQKNDAYLARFEGCNNGHARRQRDEVTSRTLDTGILSAITRIPDRDTYSAQGLEQLDSLPASVVNREIEGIRCTTRQSFKWPNMMIEVGHSEPLPQLRLDAEWWLVEKYRTDKPNLLDIEIW